MTLCDSCIIKAIDARLMAPLTYTFGPNGIRYRDGNCENCNKETQITSAPVSAEQMKNLTKKA